MLIPWVIVGAGVLLVTRWVYVWKSNRLDTAAFEHRMRNRLDLK